MKQHASGKFELPKKQTEEEDAADAEEAAARDSEEQAAECARLSPLSVPRKHWRMRHRISHNRSCRVDGTAGRRS